MLWDLMTLTEQIKNKMLIRNKFKCLCPILNLQTTLLNCTRKKILINYIPIPAHVELRDRL